MAVYRHNSRCNNGVLRRGPEQEFGDGLGDRLGDKRGAGLGDRFGDRLGDGLGVRLGNGRGPGLGGWYGDGDGAETVEMTRLPPAPRCDARAGGPPMCNSGCNGPPVKRPLRGCRRCHGCAHHRQPETHLYVNYGSCEVS